MDIATVIGIVVAFGLVLASLLMGAGLAAYVDVRSVLIVIGGTFGVIFINWPLRVIFNIGGVIKNAFFAKPADLNALTARLVTYATKARKEGILALESATDGEEVEFLRKGIQMAVDGLEPNVIQSLLEKELEQVEQRHKIGADLFTAFGTFAPAMGLIGTLIGLVAMLQSMDDPSTIGPAMAVALLTTFYGAILANMFFLPVAGKLRMRSDEEVTSMELMLEGILSISAGDNPRILETKLHAFLAPKLRETQFK
ncbi:MAG: motility protein A [Candidatus Lernaella stagnicola]|nr:motility protein A [Candidatus Lernaella stagnicola]